MKKPELLSPAGDFERLRYALAYGADAVYLAGKDFGMRTASDNFGEEELQRAVEYAHARGKRVFVTVNTMPRNEEVERLPAFLQAHGVFYHEPSKSATNFFVPALFSIRSSGLVSFPTSDSLFHGFSPG